MGDYSKLSDVALSMLVAEKVMGWTIRDGMMHGTAQKVAVDERGNSVSFTCGCTEDFCPAADLGNSAMLVIDKLREGQRTVAMECGRFCFTPLTSAEVSDGWRTCISIPRAGGCSYAGFAATLPRSICLAALAAVSNQEDRP
jgi:hypothetical protein